MIFSYRHHWELLKPMLLSRNLGFLTDQAIAECLGLGRERVRSALIFARSKGLVEERTVEGRIVYRIKSATVVNSAT